MVDPTLTISIQRAELDLEPLQFSAQADGVPLGIIEYTEPAIQANVTYAPTSRFVHGDMALGWSLQQTILGWTFVTDAALTETQSRAQIAEVRAALQRLDFRTTVEVSDAPGERWQCFAGSLAPVGPRQLENMRDPRPAWSVAIPCLPVRTVL